MTVTTLTLSDLKLHMVQRWMARSTNFLDGLIHEKPFKKKKTLVD